MIRTIFSTGHRPPSAADWLAWHARLGMTAVALVVSDQHERTPWGEELVVELSKAALASGRSVFWLVWGVADPQHATRQGDRLRRMVAALGDTTDLTIILDAEEPWLYEHARGELLRAADGRPVPVSAWAQDWAAYEWSVIAKDLTGVHWAITGHPRLPAPLISLGVAIGAGLGLPQVYDFLRPDPTNPTRPLDGHWSQKLAADPRPELRIGKALARWRAGIRAGAWRAMLPLLAAHHQHLLPGPPLARMRTMASTAQTAAEDLTDVVGVGWWDRLAVLRHPETEEVIASKETTMPTPLPQPLRRGHRGAAVRRLQDDLVHLGADIVTDGQFGRLTEAAVVDFQESHGLVVDGDMDARDLAALAEAVAAVAPATAAEPLGPRDLDETLWIRLGAALDLATGGAWSLALETGRPQPAGRTACVYGPGRGLWVERVRAEREMARGRLAPMDLGRAPGVWVATRGPGALGRSARLRSGREIPSFHCSSFTNWLAGIATGTNSRWTHTGNMPSLERLLDEHGRFSHTAQNTTVWCQGYGEYFSRLSPDGTTAEQHRLRGRGARRYLDAEELWRRRRELGALTLLGQSTLLRSGRWKYEHHTVALLRHPAWPDRLFRVAADGGRGGGGYSGTPMNIEVIDHREALRLERAALYYAHALTSLPDEIEHCPIALELGR